MFFKYQHNKIFIILTMFLFVSFFFIIRQCDYPLFFDNVFLYKLFYYQGAEKLFYNISISYIAAYFFYILQTYIPQVLSNKKAINALQNEITSELETLMFLSILINEYTTLDIGNCTREINQITSPLYFIVSDNGKRYIIRFTMGSSAKNILNYLSILHEKICSSYFFSLLDSYFSDKLSSLPIEEIEKIVNYISSGKNIKLSNSEHAINSLNNLILILKDCGLFPYTCTYEITHDKTYIKKYNRQILTAQCDEYNFQCPIS